MRLHCLFVYPSCKYSVWWFASFAIFLVYMIVLLFKKIWSAYKSQRASSNTKQKWNTLMYASFLLRYWLNNWDQVSYDKYGFLSLSNVLLSFITCNHLYQTIVFHNSCRQYSIRNPIEHASYLTNISSREGEKCAV